MKYKPEIDGLRAIAVLSVFLYHLDLHWFSGGFVGVDIFFVISGFLITSIIYRELEKGTFTFKRFYERRIRRIIPALYVVLAVCTIFTAKYFLVAEFESYNKSLVACLLFYSNMLFWNQSGYFDLDSEMKPLLHTWSLSIEEQFYIFFPALLLLLHKKYRKHLLKVLGVIFILSFWGSVVGAKEKSSMAFYFVHVRAWELLMGALIALGFFPKVHKAWFGEALNVLGLVLMGYGIFCLDQKSIFPGFNAAIPCLGAALIIYSTTHEEIKTWVGKFLGSAPLAFVGKISYSLYLWHWPVIVFTKYMVVVKLKTRHQIFIFVVSFLLSIVSWKWIEQPFRTKEGMFKDTKKIVMSLGALTLVMIVFGWMGGYLQPGMPNRLSQKVLNYSLASQDINPDRKRCLEAGLERVETNDLCALGNPEGTPKYVVWGDSHADAFMPAFRMMSEKNNVYGLNATHSACTPLLDVLRNDDQAKPGECDRFNEGMISFIEKNKIPHVVLVSNWATGGIESKDGKKKPTSKNDLTLFSFGLESTLSRLKKNGTEIWLVKKLPRASFDVPSSLGRYTMLGLPAEKLAIDYADYRKKSEQLNLLLDSLAQKYDVKLIDAASFLCSKETDRCMIEVDGHPVYRDSHHLSKFGAEYISGNLQPFYDQLITKN